MSLFPALCFFYKALGIVIFRHACVLQAVQGGTERLPYLPASFFYSFSLKIYRLT